MSEYIDKRTVVHAVPVASGSVIETRVDPRTERRGMSWVAVAALVVAGITAAVAVWMMIVNTQQRNRDDLAHERANPAAAQAVAQPQHQPSVILSVPAPVASRSQPGPVYSRPAVSATSIEIDVTSRLQNDELLRPYAVNVTVKDGIATLSGNVPDLDLKRRAEKLARAVKAVHGVVNDIVVRS